MDERRLLAWLSKWHLAPLAIRRLLHLVDASLYNPAKPNVLCLGRAHFDRDLDVMRTPDAPFGWLSIDYRLIEDAMAPLVPWHKLDLPRRQSFYPALQGPEFDEARAITDRFGTAFLGAARKRWRLDAVLTANLDYWNDDGLVTACNRSGIPFLVLSREHYITDWLRRKRVDDLTRSGFKFRGHGVAFFGHATIPTVVDTGACPADKVTVTGSPRMDAWRALEHSETPADTITLLLFKRRFAETRFFRESLLAFARASKHPDAGGIRFVMKCKNKQDQNAALKILDAEAPDHRMKITIGMPIVPLLDRSRFAFGFNSLAVLEALLSRAEIGVPHWAEAAQPDEMMLRPTPPGDPAATPSVQFFDDPETLEHTILRICREPRPPDAAERARRLDLFRTFFHFPDDTTCTELVYRFIDAHIRDTRAAPQPANHTR